MSKDEIVIIVLAVILVGLVGILIILLYPTSQIQEQDSEINDCENLSMIETVYCLRDYVSTFFKYKYTDDSMILSLETLKANGGDCKNYNEDFYKPELKKLGYNSQLVNIPIAVVNGSSYRHVFLIVYDETGYCLLSMLNAYCLEYL